MMAVPIALTCGEPAGIAPEITGKAWTELRADPRLGFFLIGDADCWQARAGVPVKQIKTPGEALALFGEALPVLHRPLHRTCVAGRLEPSNAAAVIAAIEEAAGLVLDGTASAMVTNPIQKETLYAAGFRHQGHTDFLAHLAKRHGHEAREVMMLVALDLRAVPLTVHIPLAQVPAALTRETILSQARIVNRDLKKYFGIARPRLAFTGLNPHAGENGAMGREEQDVIIPALSTLAAEGLRISGPLSADTAFHAEARSLYDAILCMYHDQALIPVKTVDFYGGVNVTLGLPFVRTSPDHGTALSIAGTGTANGQSLIAAVRLAALMAKNAGA